MNKAGLIAEFKIGFPSRKFTAGLLIAIIDFLSKLGVPGSGIQSYEELLAAYPRMGTTRSGKRANTLIVSFQGSTLSLRPFYNAVEKMFRAEEKRYDYPSCAPHATQAWSDYVRWIDALCKLNDDDLRELRQDVVDYVLAELPSQEYQPGAIRVDPPTFRLLLEGFDFTAPKREPTGAAFQGAVFGFIRADNPHLQVEIDKARTGSKRLQRIGDIDAWDGERLALTAEVKHFVVTREHLEDLAGFLNEANKRGAIALVVGEEVEPRAREFLEENGAHGLSTSDLVRIVQLWDPAKQRIAVESTIYYAAHVEKNSVLQKRLLGFLKGIQDEKNDAEDS